MSSKRQLTTSVRRTNYLRKDKEPTANIIEAILAYRPEEYRFDGQVLECWKDGSKMWELQRTPVTAIPIFNMLMAAQRERAMHQRLVNWAIGYTKGRPRRPDRLRPFVEQAIAEVASKKNRPRVNLVALVHRLANANINKAAGVDEALKKIIARKLQPVSERYVRKILSAQQFADGEHSEPLAEVFNSASRLKKPGTKGP